MVDTFRGGTPLNDHQQFSWLVEHLRSARDCARGLALSRGDMRWLMLARLMDDAADRAVIMKNRGGSVLKVLPHREPLR